MNNDTFNLQIQVIENMSNHKVVIYTSPGNSKQIGCMMFYLQDHMNEIKRKLEE